MPRSTIDRTQPDSSPSGCSGSVAWYRSTRPYGRAAAIAAPGPTAAVHRTAWATAPGWVPYGCSWFSSVMLGSWSGRLAPMPSGLSIRTGRSGQVCAPLSFRLRSAKLPAPRVSQPSSGQVGVRAEPTDSAPTAPFCASCHMVGVSIGLTSSQRSPAAPAMIT